MKLKRVALFISIILIAGVLLACAPAVAVTIANDQLTFVKMETAESYAGIVPAQGNQILTVKFLSQNAAPDLTKISEAFFGETPSTLAGSTGSYPCKSIAFEKTSGKIIANLIFEVPAGLKSQTSALTLSGSAFQPVEIKL